MSIPKKRFSPVPPDKGSFPLDHEGICKDFMSKYMNCLNDNNQKNTLCREEIKQYLDCRMNNGLMAKENWSKLGFKENERKMPNNSLDKKETNILVGCTGSVAALKIPVLIKKLMDSGPFNIKIIATEHSKHFFKKESIPEIDLISDADEWAAWHDRGDPVLHIELSKWADLLLIAPLDANTLGKLASGLCDNLLTCVARAWNPKKPLLFCPAMNTKMYEHPITSNQISVLVNWGYVEIPVISKKLICGDTGLGAMAELDTIVEEVIKAVNLS